MPSIRSCSSVSTSVASITSRSPRSWRGILAIAGPSNMFQATVTSTPAKAASGTYVTSDAASSMKSSSTTACSMPATGVRAPARTLVAVRAMVPVTQSPPRQRAADVGDALRDELAVRAMLPAGHAVGDYGGQQALNGAEQCERDGQWQQLPQVLP